MDYHLSVLHVIRTVLPAKISIPCISYITLILFIILAVDKLSGRQSRNFLI